MVNRASLIARSCARCFSTFNVARTSLFTVVQKEVTLESRNYKRFPLIDSFLNNSPWKFSQNPSSPQMQLEKEEEDIKVNVKFSYTSPDFEVTPGGEVDTDFVLTITRKSTNQGLRMFCCTTNKSEASAFAIGNVTFIEDVNNINENDYPGPDFEDLDTVLMDRFDAWLQQLGINADLCEFIVAASVDCDQQQYIKWLNNIKSLTQI
eukprot:GDKJ01039672.1.p1 GENE.GDKJ01039672.1~~GDKJ01039672.1.p1  ORF type:complete len:207 (-),score=42.71 GDKJ01039672.1:103-723(-)